MKNPPCDGCLTLVICKGKYVRYYKTYKRNFPRGLTARSFARTQLTTICPMLKSYIYTDHMYPKFYAYEKLHKFMMEGK